MVLLFYMEPKRQILIQTLADNDQNALMLIHQFEEFRQRDLVYKWFIDNKITGKRFVHYCQEKKFKKFTIVNEILNKIAPSRKSGMKFGRDTF